MSDANRVGLQGEALAKYVAALEDYQRYLAEWTEHVAKAKTYKDVCMKQEHRGERLPMPYAISALGEMSLEDAKAFFALEYRCACCVCVVWAHGRAGEHNGAMRCDGCVGRQARSRATTATRTPP